MRRDGRGNMRQRIIIHAGFAKCGSASIRAALLQNFRKSHEHNVLVFDKELRIARTPADLVGTPIWHLEQAKKKSENLTQRISDEIASVSRRKADHLVILSAENPANPGMAQLFAGLDSEFEVWVIFYLRPQLQWIPSAWKQWGLKKRYSAQRLCFSVCRFSQTIVRTRHRNLEKRVARGQRPRPISHPRPAKRQESCSGFFPPARAFGKQV